MELSFIQRYRARWFEYLSSDQENQKSILIFCKSLYLFLFVKTILVWPVALEIAAYSKTGNAIDSIIVLAATLTICLVALSIRLNYILATIIFLCSFMLSRMIQPVLNGSDLVLNLFLLLSIGLCSSPAFKSFRDYQHVLSNFTLLVCRIQLALIYFLSGYDKLISPEWRSGEAVFSITNLEFFFSSFLNFSGNQMLYEIIGWCVIVFELSFSFLIWAKQLRNWILLFGVLFHLGIIIFLNLPDFGLVMILLYSLFIQYPKRLFRKSSSVVSDDN